MVEMGEEKMLAATRPMPAHGTSGVRGWSVEQLLYGVALVIGAWLRLWNLGAQPLSPWEAANSWAAWLAAHALQVESAPAPTSALYYNLQWLLFWLGVNSDAGARFMSTVAGIAMILLPWWWRGILGRRVALIASFLIALDAWLLGFSRLADGAAVALTLVLLLLVAVSQVARLPESIVWKRMAAVAGGLLLVAGPMGWNLLPVVAWWGWLNRDALAAAGMWQRPWLVWGAGTAFAAATFWFARLDSLAWLASGMSVWLSQVDGRSAGPLLPTIAGGFDLGWPWLRLWIDAPLLLPLGLGGLVVLVKRTQREESINPLTRQLLYLCIGWLLWGLILWLLPGRNPLSLPVLGLPLLLLSAVALDAVWRTMPRDLDWREAGAVVLTLTILFVSGVLWLTALLANRNFDPILAQAALVIFALAIAILVAFAVWANRRDAAWIAAMLVAVLLVVVSLRSSWKLSFGNVLTEPAGWQARFAHPEVRLLAGDMQKLSSLRVGDPFQVPVQVQVASYVTQSDQVVPARPDPVVGWELRNMRNLAWVTAPSVADDANPLPLVVTPAVGEEEVAQLDLPPNYAGSRYHVDAWWLPQTLEENRVTPVVDANQPNQPLRAAVSWLQPWWRWLIYREPTREPINRDVVLWAPVEDVRP